MFRVSGHAELPERQVKARDPTLGVGLEFGASAETAVTEGTALFQPGAAELRGVNVEFLFLDDVLEGGEPVALPVLGQSFIHVEDYGCYGGHLMRLSFFMELRPGEPI